MGSEELAANLFRITQTEAKLKKDNIEGESEANKTHYNIGKNIREVIAKNGGTMPEDLPAPNKSLKKLEKERSGLFIYNLGMGKGVSVLEMVETFKRVNKVDVPYKIVSRRPGDIATCYSDPTKAREELGFTCEKTLEDMVRSAWNYEHKNI